jgi:diacylglycerol kinase (ATP)
MRLALYFNPTAGARSFSGSDVTRVLRSAGYDVECFDKKEDTITEALASRPDVLVAAGGDGTVANAAKELLAQGSTVPLYVIPLGTSNNIARSLGVDATVPVLAEALATARDMTLDVGRAVSNGDAVTFVEAVGAGFFGVSLRRAHSWREQVRRLLRRLRRRDTKGEAYVREAASGIARQLRRSPARSYRVIADGEDLSGDYVGVEAMYIEAIGPRARLAPGADTHDGALELVLIRSEDREALADFIARPDMAPPRLERRRVRELRLSCQEGDGHIDDEPWPSRGGHRPSGSEAHISIGGAIRIMLPRS